MERSVVVAISEGLHARPAALFARTAARLPVTVRIARPGGSPVNASSVLALMTLGADAGDEVVLSTESDGDDAVAALDELADFLAQEVPVP